MITIFSFNSNNRLLIVYINNIEINLLMKKKFKNFIIPIISILVAILVYFLIKND